MMERIGTLEGFRALRPDWEALYERSGQSNLFLTWSWLATWIEHLSEGFVALVHRSHRGEVPDAAAIFATDSPRHWCWISEHSYRPGVLHVPGFANPLRPFLAYAALRAPGVASVMLHRAPDDEQFRSELQRTLGPLARFLVPREPVLSHLIATDTSFEAYLKDRARKVRQELNRKIRLIERERPDIELIELPPGSTGDQAIDMVEKVERDSWKAESKTAIISNQRERRFYRAVFELHDERTRGRMFALAGSSGPIAFLLGVQHDDVFYALKTSHREDHAKYSSGQVLFYRLIERFCDHEPGVRQIELLGQDSRWKRELATSTREERTFEIMRPGPTGALRVLAANHVIPALREAAQRDPRVANFVALAKRLRAQITKSETTEPGSSEPPKTTEP